MDSNKPAHLDRSQPLPCVISTSLLLIRAKPLVKSALSEEPKTQTQLARIDAEDQRFVEGTLREACRRLLGIEEWEDDYMETPGDAAVVANAARYVASRICAPRDMSAPAASVLV